VTSQPESVSVYVPVDTSVTLSPGYVFSLVQHHSSLTSRIRCVSRHATTHKDSMMTTPTTNASRTASLSLRQENYPTTSTSHASRVAPLVLTLTTQLAHVSRTAQLSHCSTSSPTWLTRHANQVVLVAHTLTGQPRIVSSTAQSIQYPTSTHTFRTSLVSLSVPRRLLRSSTPKIA
jgi:hypothetical protein